ncbi:MAG TPA: hypothetical protein VGF59_35155 [Bryobacteraceae bacterium]|jgi:hypothetical protein
MSDFQDLHLDVAFWNPTSTLDAAPPVPAGAPSALERLGPSPFPRSGFPFLGFLATVYDHVATHVGGAPASPSTE